MSIFDNTNMNILNQLPKLVFWKDTSSVYLGCNNVFSQFCGLDSIDDIKGCSDSDLPWSSYQEAIYREEDHIIVNELVEIKDRIVPVNLGSNFSGYLQGTKKPLYDGNKLVGVIGICDILTREDALNKLLKQMDDSNIVQFSKKAIKPFSKRETELILYLLKGYTGVATADRMEISIRTVESYLENIKNKLNVNTRQEIYSVMLDSCFVDSLLFC